MLNELLIRCKPLSFVFTGSLDEKGATEWEEACVYPLSQSLWPQKHVWS